MVKIWKQVLKSVWDSKDHKTNINEISKDTSLSNLQVYNSLKMLRNFVSTKKIWKLSGKMPRVYIEIYVKDGKNNPQSTHKQIKRLIQNANK